MFHVSEVYFFHNIHYVYNRIHIIKVFDNIQMALDERHMQARSAFFKETSKQTNLNRAHLRRTA